MELMKNAKKALKMPIYWIKWLKMSTSGRPDEKKVSKEVQISEPDEINEKGQKD